LARQLADSSTDAWVFPSETGKTPLAKDNCWRRKFLPKLQEAGIEWANFQVMRRTHSSLMRKLGVDPKLVADQLGHTLDVKHNVYTETISDKDGKPSTRSKKPSKSLNGAFWSRRNKSAAVSC